CPQDLLSLVPRTGPHTIRSGEGPASGETYTPRSPRSNRAASRCAHRSTRQGSRSHSSPPDGARWANERRSAARRGRRRRREETHRACPNGSRRRARGQIDDPELLADLDRIVSDDKRRLREYVLHPRPVGNLKGRPPDVVPAKWNKPMDPSTMHHWFKRCI